MNINNNNNNNNNGDGGSVHKIPSMGPGGIPFGVQLSIMAGQLNDVPLYWSNLFFHEARWIEAVEDDAERRGVVIIEDVDSDSDDEEYSAVATYLQTIGIKIIKKYTITNLLLHSRPPVINAR
jgi:hypothetical protein